MPGKSSDVFYGNNAQPILDFIAKHGEENIDFSFGRSTAPRGQDNRIFAVVAIPQVTLVDDAQITEKTAYLPLIADVPYTKGANFEPLFARVAQLYSQYR